MIMLDDKLYLCRPARNVACRKTNCYVNGGPCMCTSEKSYGDDGITLGIVQTGKWIDSKKGYYICSNCEATEGVGYFPYCKMCGAKMAL